MSAYTETIARFGSQAALVGILANPAARRGDGPTVVIVNTGVVHRIGNHRMNVIFARTLAAAGFPVLRFDFAGLGDSAARKASSGPSETGVADLGDALDWLEAQGHRDIVLMGLCAGADLNVVYAGGDRRVRGVILLDPTMTPTVRFVRNRMRHHLARLTHGNPLPNLVRRLRRRHRVPGPSSGNDEQRSSGPLALLKRRHIRGFLQDAYLRVVANEVDILAVLTSDVQSRHNYREQLIDAFPRVRFGDRLELHYLEGASHLLLFERDRAKCLAIVLAWLTRHGAAGAGGA